MQMPEGLRLEKGGAFTNHKNGYNLQNTSINKSIFPSNLMESLQQFVYR